MNKEKLKVKIFLILSLVFAILTLIGGYLVITHKLDNAGYSVIPNKKRKKRKFESERKVS